MRNSTASIDRLRYNIASPLRRVLRHPLGCRISWTEESKAARLSPRDRSNAKILERHASELCETVRHPLSGLSGGARPCSCDWKSWDCYFERNRSNRTAARCSVPVGTRARPAMTPEIGSQLAKAWFEKEGNLTVQLDGGLALGGLLEVPCHLRAWPWLDKSNPG